MRIITGSAKGTRLETLEGEMTRPTSEKVKEAIFSMIQFDVEGKRILDLFGGSGQLGLEALSRGADVATFVDSSREAAELIKRNAQKAKLFDRCRVLSTDWLSYLNGAAGRERFDIVFIDPPYASELAHKAADKLYEDSLLADNAIVICETCDKQPVEHNGLVLRRHNRYGKTYISLYVVENGNSDIVMA
jgi:RNA methyltransferase, rsmD family